MQAPRGCRELWRIVNQAAAALHADSPGMRRLPAGSLVENQAPPTQSIPLVGEEKQDRTENDYDCGDIKRKSRDQRLYSFAYRRFRRRLSYFLMLSVY